MLESPAEFGWGGAWKSGGSSVQPWTRKTDLLKRTWALKPPQKFRFCSSTKERHQLRRETNLSKPVSYIMSLGEYYQLTGSLCKSNKDLKFLSFPASFPPRLSPQAPPFTRASINSLIGILPKLLTTFPCSRLCNSYLLHTCLIIPGTVLETWGTAMNMLEKVPRCW